MFIRVPASMQVFCALISLSFAASLGIGAAHAQPAADWDAPIVTGPAAAPAHGPVNPAATAPASNGPLALVNNAAPFPAAAARPEAPTEAVTSSTISQAEQADTPDRIIEISPTMSVGSRRLFEDKASGGLLRSNPGLQRADRKSFGFGMKF